MMWVMWVNKKQDFGKVFLKLGLVKVAEDVMLSMADSPKLLPKIWMNHHVQRILQHLD
jgi:hypothetical protein